MVTKMTTEITEQQQFKLELFKLEYVQAAQRYENIYKAIWQIFSYMAALTAAILAFASRNIPLLLVILIAPFPLVFWFVAIYLPMDNYGQQSRTTLSDIETNLNQEFLYEGNYQFSHFCNFNKKRPRFRVRYAVIAFALIGGLIWFLSLFLVASNHSNQLGSNLTQFEHRFTTPVKVQLQEPQAQDLNKELQILSNKLDSIESLLRERNKPVTK